MKILVVSDEESPALWDYYVPGRLDEYDLILSCGDLKASYLTFLVTMSRQARLFYVHGNHDEDYLNHPPEGCVCIDDQLVVYNGIRILGLGGCMRYHPGPFQYSEAEMRWRIAKLKLALWRSKGVDIVVAHTPPKDLGDMPDPAHRGFQVFKDLIEQYHPAVFLHGHVHLRYNIGLPRERNYQGTRLINASERYVLEIPDRAVPQTEKNRLIWKTRHREKI
ncbi:MAG: metallophosphoesterase family protein [Firmicutes bacterium]|nr:metallophosphoesterase family protein [Bacillota bacterium]